MIAQSACFSLPSGAGYDALEVHTATDDGASCTSWPHGDELPQGETPFWSLYGHLEEGGLECIGDFVSFADACNVARKLGGLTP